jgi:hypothetical protein
MTRCKFIFRQILKIRYVRSRPQLEHKRQNNNIKTCFTSKKVKKSQPLQQQAQNAFFATMVRIPQNDPKF